MSGTTKQMTTAPDAAFEYIKELECQVKEALADYNGKKATRDAAFSKYSKTVAWLAQLKVYCTAIEKTNLCATSLISLLDNAINQVCSVSETASFGVSALRYLLLDMDKVSCCIEKLQVKADEFNACVSQLPATDPIAVEYKKLQDAIAEAMKCVKEAINNLLADLEQTELVVAGLADHTFSPGLTGYLEILKDDFTTGNPRPDYDSVPCASSGVCNTLQFPLDTKLNPYYVNTLKDCESVEDSIYSAGGLLDKYEVAEDAMNAAKNCYEALVASLKAASAAKSCAKK